ncbi:hypothetical protein B0T18DRAFT_440780 [Schizothecium vesticola]|uniref:Uncharacterized protein n=1 Tax=Schizothecium vesticola TaxID=314040 RepID=A0AA40EFB6_9PEZI|nr:hypothetical protein B0T18DRAFT_440780 [Schizothecium vesticola]
MKTGVKQQPLPDDGASRRYTSSRRASVLDYPFERGWRYHAFRAGNYMLANDEEEMIRLDLLHKVMTKRIGNKMFLAPVDGSRISRILDMGTRTSIYDLESPWAYGAPFDFIFGRCLVTSIKDWPGLVQSAYELRWLELQNFDPVIRRADPRPPNTAPLWSGPTSSSSLARSWGGFWRGRYEKVGNQTFDIPFGTWAKDRALKELGILFAVQMIQGLEAISLRLMCNVVGWELENVKEFLGKVRREFEANEHRFYVVL